MTLNVYILKPVIIPQLMMNKMCISKCLSISDQDRKFHVTPDDLHCFLGCGIQVTRRKIVKKQVSKNINCNNNKNYNTI